MKSGLQESSLHLVDHWLSFFMVKNLPVFQDIVRQRLGVSWDRHSFEDVRVTQYEERGLEGRGEFFDGVGQVRDMIQSHLLQVLALALVDPATAAADRSRAKLELLRRVELTGIRHGQYDGFLLEPKLKFHPSFADTTFSNAHFSVDTDAWQGVNFTISTGKDMGTLLYTVEFFQRGGPGVLTYEIGKEETGRAGIKVANWPLKDSSSFLAPTGGFDASQAAKMTPAVKDGNGYIAQYVTSMNYFPNPYSVLTSALLARDYGVAFVTYPECRQSWIIVESTSASVALDPPPEKVLVYKEGLRWEGRTVKDLYNIQFSCTPGHDKTYGNISLYQAKCHPGMGSPSRLRILYI